jgi:hypothetical protein
MREQAHRLLLALGAGAVLGGILLSQDAGEAVRLSGRKALPERITQVLDGSAMVPLIDPLAVRRRQDIGIGDRSRDDLRYDWIAYVSIAGERATSRSTRTLASAPNMAVNG